jgi:hypothetical protein
MRKVAVISIIAVLATLVTVVASCSTATTTSIVVTPASAVQLVFTTQPDGASAGSLLTTQPVVVAKDANGNTVANYKGPIILSIMPGTGASGAKLFGGTTMIPLNGAVTFLGLSINLAGSGYKLIAKSGSLTSAISDPFDIAPGTAFRLVFTTQTTRAQAGSAFTIAVAVTDSSGNVVTSSTALITLSLISGRVGVHSGTTVVALSGTMKVNAINGVATFSDVSINLAGTGFKLMATSSGLASVSGDPFIIISGTPVKLAFGIQPAGATAKSPFINQPVVWVVDTNGNICELSGSPVSVSLSIMPGTGTQGAVLSGTTKIDAVNQIFDCVAVFDDLSIDLAGSGYKLMATSSSLPSATSDAFDVATSPP